MGDLMRFGDYGKNGWDADNWNKLIRIYVWRGDLSPVANFRCKAYYNNLENWHKTGILWVSLCLTESMIIYLDVDAGLYFGFERVQQWLRCGLNLEENWLLWTSKYISQSGWRLHHSLQSQQPCPPARYHNNWGLINDERHLCQIDKPCDFTNVLNQYSCISSCLHPEENLIWRTLWKF